MFDRLRAAWRAFWNSTTAPMVDEPPAPRRISQAAMWEADRHGGSAFLPEDIYVRPAPMPGTLPNGMAMDSALPSLDAVSSYALQQMYHEGLGFLGYPYLAELSQRAEYRRMASIWAEHCTRKWIKLNGDDEKVKLIEQELDRLDAREKFRAAIEKECFFGRIHLFMDFGDFDKPAELAAPLAIDPRKISKARPLKRLSIVEPMWSYPGPYDSQNPLSPDFYKPSSWYVSGRTVHASRLLTMVGHEMPNMLKPAYAFGGVSLTQIAKPYVDNWLRTRQSVSDLIDAFSVMVLKTDMDSVLGGGDGKALYDRLDIFNKTRSNRGTFAVDKTSEDFANVSAPIAGLDKLQSQSQEQMSSVSGIPLVVLLGITPSGLNASSEGEIRVFYDAILAYDEEVLTPNISTLLDVVQLSLFGKIDEEITFEFIPLWEMSDKDKADIRKSDADADRAYVDMGAVDPEEVRERLRNDETSLYHGVDLSGPAPEPPDDGEDEESLPFAGDGWNEGDHPRDKDGKFGSGSGGGSGAAPSSTEILQHVSKVLQSKGNTPALSLGAPTSGNVDLVKAQTGVDLSGYTRALEASEIRHAMNRHSNAAKEAERGQVAIGKQDFARIPEIVENAHKVELKGKPRAAQPQRLVYTAMIGNHEYEYVEEIRERNRLVALKTMLKR